MKRLRSTRIYVNDSLLAVDKILLLDKQHSHYLKTVLRLQIGDKIRVFNSSDGEFLASIIEIAKNNALIQIENFLRQPLIEPALILGLCLIKTDKMLDAINMAVQLGVTQIIPISSAHSQSYTINSGRWQKCIIEAAEQSERLAVPSLSELVSLPNYKDLDLDMIFYANERDEQINSLITKNITLPPKISVIIGPEGGFSDKELIMLASWGKTHSISINANILRSETATAAALTQLQLIRTAQA